MIWHILSKHRAILMDLHFSWQLNTDVCHNHNLLCSYLRRRCLQSFLSLKGKVAVDRVKDYSYIFSYFQGIFMAIFRTRFDHYGSSSKRFVDLGQKSWPKYTKIPDLTRASNIGRMNT